MSTLWYGMKLWNGLRTFLKFILYNAFEIL